MNNKVPLQPDNTHSPNYPDGPICPEFSHHHTAVQVFVEVEPTADRIDRATQYAQSFNETALEAFRRSRIWQGTHVQERIQQGLREICEECGGPIPTDRLTAVPDATRCLRCQINSESRNAGRTVCVI